MNITEHALRRAQVLMDSHALAKFLEEQPMPRDWEDQLRRWSKPPGQPEQEKMTATESQIREAIRSSSALSSHEIQIAAQGSYYNLTHVPRESDVDIRVVCRDAIFTDLTFIDPRVSTDPAVKATVRKRLGLSDSPYAYATFRDDVGKALVARFGPAPAVTPGDKAFNVSETRYHVDADVVAALEHRRYRADGSYDEGVEFVSRKGVHIINWPAQQHRNGVEKNQATGERFKAMVRALKNLRIEMDDESVGAAANISSFLIECLTYNVPNDRFNHATYYDDMKELLRYVYLNTKADEDCHEWREESRLKWLLRGGQPWTRAQVNAFVLAAWNHVGFKN